MACNRVLLRYINIIWKVFTYFTETGGSHVYWKTNCQALLLMIVTKCHLNIGCLVYRILHGQYWKSVTYIYYLLKYSWELICYWMVWSKCPPINVLKKRYGLKIMIKAKKLVVSWSITFACSKGGIKLIVYKSCGVSLDVKCKTCTIRPAQQRCR